MIPSLAVSPLPLFFAQATVESRSFITCSSGTFDTTFEMMSGISLIFETSPSRRVQFRSDGEIAELRKPAADVLDMFVDAKNLLHDKNYRKPALSAAQHDNLGSRHRKRGS